MYRLELLFVLAPIEVESMGYARGRQHGDDLFRRLADGRCAERFQLLHQRNSRLVNDRVPELLLRAEVIVDERLCHAGLSGDLGDARSFVALPGQQHECSAADIVNGRRHVG